MVNFSNQTAILEWCVVKCGCKNRHQQDMFEIGLQAQNMLTVLHSTVNIIGGNLYDHLMPTRIFTSTMNKIFI